MKEDFDYDSEKHKSHSFYCIMHLLTVGMQHFYYTCIVLGIIHSFIKFRKQFGHKFDGYIRFNTPISNSCCHGFR